jgi:hypothetical protein
MNPGKTKKHQRQHPDPYAAQITSGEMRTAGLARPLPQIIKQEHLLKIDF